jgi:hypothetical protein
VETLAKEVDWKEREVHNNVEAAHWEIEAPNGWGSTRPTSPIHKGWPSTEIVEDGTWPLLSDVVPLCPDSWPDLSLPVQDGIQVTIKVKTSVEESEGHSACRSLVFLGCLSVLDLLSSLCHSAIGTSIRSCAHHGACGGADQVRVHEH